MQRAEVYITKKAGKKKDLTAPSPAPATKTKKPVPRLKAVSPKLQKDETLEVGLFPFLLNAVE